MARDSDIEHVISTVSYFLMSVFFTGVTIIFIRDSQAHSKILARDTKNTSGRYNISEFKYLQISCILSIISSIFMSIIPSISSFAHLININMYTDDKETELSSFWESLRITAWFAFMIAEISFLYFQVIRLRFTFNHTIYQLSNKSYFILYSLFILSILCAIMIFITILPNITLSHLTMGIIYLLTLFISVLLPIIVTIYYAKNLLTISVTLTKVSFFNSSKMVSTVNTQSGVNSVNSVTSTPVSITNNNNISQFENGKFPDIPSVTNTPKVVHVQSPKVPQTPQGLNGLYVAHPVPQMSLSPSLDLEVDKENGNGVGGISGISGITRMGGREMDRSDLNDEQKELLEVIAKQTVLSFVQSMCFLVYFVYTCISLLNGTLFENMYGNAAGTFMEIICWFACIVWPTCIWFSFSFSNKEYKMFCSMCHNSCLRQVEKIAIYKIELERDI